MDSRVADLELGEMTAMTVTQTCHAQHHKCRSCERTRSVKIRVLSWFLAKLSLILVIVITSAASTFFYHKILPDDVQHSYATASSVDVIAEPRGGTRVNKETTGTKVRIEFYFVSSFISYQCFISNIFENTFS